MNEQDARYPSQQLPQLPVVRLGREHLWMLEAVERYQAAYEKEHERWISLAEILRDALDRWVVKSKSMPSGFVTGKSLGDAARMGAFRLAMDWQHLPGAVSDASKRWNLEHKVRLWDEAVAAVQEASAAANAALKKPVASKAAAVAAGKALDAVSRAASADVTDADVIRGALAQWLIDKGYGPKKGKG